MIEPRYYQARTLESVRTCEAAGSKATLVVSPTGSGKTVMGALDVAHHLNEAPGNAAVWIAHRTELIEQAAKTLFSFGLSVSVRGSSRGAQVSVESTQTILARGRAPRGTKLYVDECHHFADDNECARIVAAYPMMLGLTATPERGDGKPLKPPYQTIVVAAQISELIALWHKDHSQGLVPLSIRCPDHRIGPKAIAQRPVDAYLEHAPGERAIVFANNIKNAEAIRDDFVALGVKAAIVKGTMAKDVRAAILNGHRAGDFPVLVNCGVLTEGYDDTAISCIVVARQCKSQGLWLQQTGRGLRPHPGKLRCILIDLCGIVHKLGRPDSDRVFTLDGEQAISCASNVHAFGVRLCSSCKEPLGDMAKCPICGLEGTPILVATGAKLVSHETMRKAAAEQLGTSRAAQALAGMLRKHGGRMTREISGKFRGIFRRWPSDDLVREAETFNRLLGVIEAENAESQDLAAIDYGNR